MPFLGDEVAVRQVSEQRWKLLEPLSYEGNVDTFEVPAGFETDFASVPRAFWWLIPRYGEYTRASILHDHLCRKAEQGDFGRADADGIFRRSMRELGVPFLRRRVMWAAVRFGSGWSSLADRPGEALLAVAWGLLAAVFLFVPAVLVTVWLALTWLLEWLLCPFLVLWPGGDEVKPPWPAKAD